MATAFNLSKYIRSFFEDYLVCRRNLSNATIRSYRDVVKLFIRFLVRQTRKSTTDLLVSDVEDTRLVAFLAHLEKDRNNSIQTRNHRLTVLRRLFEYISAEEPRVMDLCRKLLNVPTKRTNEHPEISYLEKEELAAILESVDIKTTLGRRDYAILLFMYNTGARVQEAADVRLGWISFHAPYKAELLGKGRKWRTCPLWKTTIKALQACLADRNETPAAEATLFINRFGRPLSRFGIRTLIAKYKNKASLHFLTLKAKKVSPHTLRHTTAMHLLQSGVDINVIRSWLGHVKLETTHRYAEIDLAMKAKALEACRFQSKKTIAAKWRSDPDLLKWLETL